MPPADPSDSEAGVGLWLHPGAHPGPSSIAGHGLFTAVALAPGTTVARASGRAERVSGAVGANHSCDPNLGWAPDPIGGSADHGAGNGGVDHGAGVLVALRHIAAGEELTHDYATSIAAEDFMLRCNCGSMRCRGLIEGGDWRIPELRRRYAGRFAPDVQHLVDGGG